MPAVWTDPLTFVFKKPLSAAQANTYIRDNLLWLKAKPRNFVTLTGITNPTPSLTTSFGAVDDTQFTLTVTTSVANEEVFLTYSGNVSLATGAQYLVLDWLMDTSTYVSNMSATPVTLGSFYDYMLTASVQYHIQASKRVIVPTPGTHTFKLRAKVNTTGCVATFYTNSGVTEMGVLVE